MIFNPVLHNALIETSRNEESVCERINQSMKKTNKISIYSKKSTKSPKKHQSSQIAITNNSRDFQALFTSNKLNNYNFTQLNNMNQNNISQQLHQNNKIQFKKQNSITKSNQVRQQSCEQVLEQNFFAENNYKIKRNDALKDVRLNNKIVQNYEVTRNNQHNISSMIDKQTRSEVICRLKKVNNLSLLEGSFMTGAKVDKGKNVLSQISNLSNGQQQDVMQNLMKCMQEQIYVAKQNYSKKFNQILKLNAKTTRQLHDKIKKNQILVKHKDSEIQRLKQSFKYRDKRITSMGQVGCIKSQALKAPPKSQGVVSIGAYDSRRTADLQAKLRVLYNLSLKANQSQRIEKRMQILQKGFLKLFNAKIGKISSHVCNFTTKYSKKLSAAFESCQKVKLDFIQMKQQYSISNTNQKHVKQISTRLNDLQKQYNQFSSKQFKYENFTVYQLQNQFKALKQNLRQLQSHQFQNSKLIKALSEQLIKTNAHSNLNRQNVSSLSQINQTYNKYTINNPNVSKIYMDQMNNTHEYSHLLEKLTPKHINNNILNNTKFNDQSMISMSFTQQSSQRTQQHAHVMEMFAKPDSMNYEFATMSKYTKATHIKQTKNCPVVINSAINQGNKKMPYYLPTTSTNTISTNTTGQKHTTFTVNSTQDKIRNLNQLKMESKQQLIINKTPTKKSTHNYNISKENDNSNTSYWSIGQMEDFKNVSRDIINQTNDFCDDEFFYPGKVEQQLKNSNRNSSHPKIPSPQKNSRNTQILNIQEISPMKKKNLISTSQNFYKHSQNYLESDPKQNKQQKPDPKYNFMYNSSFDYENFYDQDDQRQVKIQQNLVFKDNFNAQKKKHPYFTSNQLNFVDKCKILNKFEYPVKMICDSKKREGMIRMSNSTHPLNGKTFLLQKKQIEKLQDLGFLQVKTYL